MLVLSNILLVEGSEITSFDELKKCIVKTAIKDAELFFTIDIEPPVYSDRPNDWHDQLNLAFESAR